MFCERSYSIPEGVRLFCDPEDECVACQGRGFRSWWDADCGWAHEACPACMGRASAGHYLVYVLFGDMRVQSSWQTHKFDRAVGAAARYALMLRPEMARRACVSEVVVVFVPTGGAEKDEEVVFAATCWKPEPTRAA